MTRLAALQERIDHYVVEHGREPTAALIQDWIHEILARDGSLSSPAQTGVGDAAAPDRASHSPLSMEN